MLLSALKEYAGRSKDQPDSLPDFYDRQEVRYRIDLDADGNLLDFTPLVDPDRPKRGMRLAIPYLKRTVGVVPFPVDRGDYVLGIPATRKTEEDQAKAAARSPVVHAAYVALLADAAEETGLPALAAMRRFAEGYQPDNDTKRPEGFDASSFVVIYVDGALVTEDLVLQRWWAERQRKTSGGRLDSERLSVCGVCALPAEPVEWIPVAIRGLGAIGGKATMALVSGNMDVFERHGLARAMSASLCLDCGRATHQALNQLIADPTHAKRLGTSIFVWWATEETEDWLAALLDGDTEESVRDVLDSLATGKAQPSLDSSRFYGLSLGANSIRVVVRTWVDATLRDTQEHIGCWFNRMGVVDKSGSPGQRPGLLRLLASLAPPGKGDALSRIDPKLPTALLESALTGRALPPAVLSQVLARVRSEQGAVTALRAALLKACITPVDHPNLEEYMQGLDTTVTDPAYLCGRLLALLDDAARLATSANNTLVNRSYSSSSTMPAITLTRLLRLHRAHLDKLERDSPGAARRIDVNVAEILSGLEAAGLPRTLSVSEQGRFALGLYHQQAAGRAAAAAGAAAKAVRSAAGTTSAVNPIDTTEATDTTDEEFSR